MCRMICTWKTAPTTSSAGANRSLARRIALRSPTATPTSFDDLDGRSKRARRYGDIKNDLLFELHYPRDLLTRWSVKQLAAMLVLLEEASMPSSPVILSTWAS